MTVLAVRTALVTGAAGQTLSPNGGGVMP